jgi:hypothetical protein
MFSGSSKSDGLFEAEPQVVALPFESCAAASSSNT